MKKNLEKLISIIIFIISVLLWITAIYLTFNK